MWLLFEITTGPLKSNFHSNEPHFVKIDNFSCFKRFNQLNRANSVKTLKFNSIYVVQSENDEIGNLVNWNNMVEKATIRLRLI